MGENHRRERSPARVPERLAAWSSARSGRAGKAEEDSTGAEHGGVPGRRGVQPIERIVV